MAQRAGSSSKIYSSSKRTATHDFFSVVNPATGKLFARVAEGTAKDVDLAVEAAQKAFETTWGLNTPGYERGRLLYKLAELIEQRQDEIAALEALNVGKAFSWAKNADVVGTIAVLRYYAGFADKIHGKTIETSKDKIAYTIREPLGVVGQIVPWNFPCTHIFLHLWYHH